MNVISLYVIRFYYLAKVEVAGSNPVSRSKEFKGLGVMLKPFFFALIPIASVFASVCKWIGQKQSVIF